MQPIQLTNQDHSLVRQVYNDMLRGNDLNNPYVSGQLWYKEPEKVTPNLMRLLEHTSHLLNSYNLKCSSQRWFAEIHRSKANGNKVQTPLAWHQDDEGGWPEKHVVTAIYYLKKDPGLTGLYIFLLERGNQILSNNR